ncbi:MAG: hypothetical protein AB7T07_06920 [Steroidobacteraceae bacterium]
MQSFFRKYWLIYLTSCGLLVSMGSAALDRTRLQIEQLQGDEWQAQKLEVMLQLNTRPLHAQVKAARVTLTGIKQPIRELLIDCPEVELLADSFACRKARITGLFPYLGQQSLRGEARYQRSSGAISLKINDLRFAQGQAALAAQLDDAGWRGELDLKAVDIAALLQLASKASLPLQLSGTGQVDAQLHAQGAQTQLDTLNWRAQVRELSVNNDTGTLATDRLGFTSQGSAHHRKPSGWQISAQLDASSGQAYAEPVFVDFGQYPAQLNAQTSTRDANLWELKNVTVKQQHIVIASAQGQIDLRDEASIPNLQVHIDELQFPGTFTTYLQPFLLNSSLKNLNTGGSLQGEVRIQDTAPVSVDLQLQALHADDGGSNLRFDEVNGDIHWRNALEDDNRPPRSGLSWQSGSLLGLELGTTQMALELWDTNLRVAAPTRIPVFNGALAIDAFRVRKVGTAQMAFMLDAAIEPINVAQISKAFGWPEFGGELSGKITKLRMEDGVLTLGATLKAQVFDGEVSIGNMRMEGALTQWPRFTANIALQRLDLEQVTQAFSFGRITGRLSGEINELELFNWQPVAFDARLYTPANDRSRHRISQRAVQNIGSIGGSGGGVAAALQSGFLKFFEDFNYDKLGLSCKLVNEVCLMNGVAPAKGGSYYLVKGKGLPRIDVIGNARRVDWPRLAAQLKAVTESEGPVIK